MRNRTSIVNAEPLRRSPRFLNPADPRSNSLLPSSYSSLSSKATHTHRRCKAQVSAKSVDGFEILRRSSRLVNQRNANWKNESCGELRRSSRVAKSAAGVLLDIGNIININCVSSKSARKKVLADGRKVCKGDVRCELVKEEKGREENGVERKRKRKRDEACNEGWTDEQEKALQRAYFASKPTPNFWKKVAKLVPGKSAQECFDKIHCDHLTPPQLPPRSRVKKSDASSVDCSSLSASKLLLSTKLNGKRPISNRRKSYVAQKTVRDMLQKHYHLEEDYETDLFSVLEPNTDPSAQAVQPSVVLSTPENSQEKLGFLQKCCERSSSGHKKPISRFNSSCGDVLGSPPVLKQVKNWAMHEKYIDQLHCRDAKRKAVSARAEKFFTRKDNPEECCVQKIDVVRGAKVALVCEARDAISQLQRLQADAMTNSCDYFGDEDPSNDGDDEDEVEDEGEDEP